MEDQREYEATAHVRLALAGVMGIGVAFGFARYGYGLFLPEIRTAFGLSLTLVGAVSSATYLGYLTALTLVGVLADRTGPRPLIVIGGLSAAVGMGLVALAQDVVVLTVGLVLAGTSSGWAWAPYSDAVDRMLPLRRRQGVLALLPTGTAFATVVAGVLALTVPGAAWRWVWVFFAVAAVAVTAYNARVLPGGPDPARPAIDRSSTGLAWLMRRPAAPLYASALSYGLVGAVFWSFAVEAVSGSPDSGSGTAALFWTLMGAAGTAGVLTGRLIDRAGLRGAHTVLFGALATAVALVGIAPGSVAAVAASAVAYGAAFMAISGLLAVWSHRVFPERPSAGFSATVFFLGVGTVVGPVVFGAAADQVGTGTAFLIASAVAVGTLATGPKAAGRRPRAATPAEDRADDRPRDLAKS
ncbi:MFS transporter [Nocardiopsis gilva]|uniref:MFS transporter n=2 Tax=Nocardiopsis gilva TaxID=280236 RepID=UPI0018E01CED|nr:MFS transporter [Nocardiopsis gilva]